MPHFLNFDTDTTIVMTNANLLNNTFDKVNKKQIEEYQHSYRRKIAQQIHKTAQISQCLTKNGSLLKIDPFFLKIPLDKP